jgi:hypothetical protein
MVLICLIAYQSRPKVIEKEQRAKVEDIKMPKITIGRDVKTVPVISENKNEVKHSTTWRNYFDTNGRRTTGLNHNIRIGRDYYISGGVTSRQSSYGQNDFGAEISCTKYW